MGGCFYVAKSALYSTRKSGVVPLGSAGLRSMISPRLDKVRCSDDSNFGPTLSGLDHVL